MAIEIGKTYYFMPHAYHHWIGELVEILGGNRFVLNNVRRIQSCRRGWSEFFRDGAGTDTTYTTWPDGFVVDGSFGIAPWNHKIPVAQ